MLGVAQNYRRSILRDREVEMIHRGVQYARAVASTTKRIGRYPTSIEQLENTNKIRYLRKRYKDPMSPDGAVEARSCHRYKAEDRRRRNAGWRNCNRNWSRQRELEREQEQASLPARQPLPL